MRRLICPKCGDNRIIYRQGKHICKNCGKEFQRATGKDMQKFIIIGSVIILTVGCLIGIFLKLWLKI